MSWLSGFFKHNSWAAPVAETLGAVGGSLLLGPEVGAALGIGATAGGALAGAAGGALGGAISGQSPTGILEAGALGGLGGAASGAAGLGLGAASGGGAVAGPATSATSALTDLGTSVAGPSASSVAAPSLASSAQTLDDLTSGGSSIVASANTAAGAAPDAGATLMSVNPSTGALLPTGAGALPSGGPAAAGSAASLAGGVNPVSGAASAANAADFAGTAGGTAAPGTWGGIWNAAKSGDASGALQGLGGKALDNLGPIVAGAGLLHNMTTQSSIPGVSQLTNLAQTSATQGQVLQTYLNTGTLPPAIQASVDQATADGITAIKSKYASMGVAPGSQAEVADINHLKQNAVVQGATLADQLLQQGISESNMAGALYNELVGTNVQLNNQTNQAIGNLASSLAGGVNLRIGGTNVPVQTSGG